MPCTKCKDGKYKWGETGECKYDSKEACESANHKYNKMQPTPLGKKSYEEYEKELKEYKEINLSKVVRVELGVKELAGLAKQLNKNNEEIRNFGNKMMSASSVADANEGAIKNEIKEIEKGVKELGLNIADIPSYKEAKTVLNKYDKLRKEFNL
tara:strand:+ start:149 stop:610 length:462 start_codon:yes stop_codon:yes gene_type:complete